MQLRRFAMPAWLEPVTTKNVAGPLLCIRFAATIQCPVQGPAACERLPTGFLPRQSSTFSALF